MASGLCAGGCDVSNRIKHRDQRTYLEFLLMPARSKMSRGDQFSRVDAYLSHRRSLWILPWPLTVLSRWETNLKRDISRVYIWNEISSRTVLTTWTLSKSGGSFRLQCPVQKRATGESQQRMGISGQSYHIPLPSGPEPAAIAADRLERGNMGNISPTSCTGKVVGDSITELKAPATSKMRYERF